MKLVKILSVFAVFAAAGMVTAGCDGPAGTGAGDEAVFTEPGAPVLNSAGGATYSDTAATKKIKIKFEVKNGGMGLVRSWGIVSTQDDSYLVYDGAHFANDFTIVITVPASDTYLNIRWKGSEAFEMSDRWTWLKARTPAESGTILLDYNGYGSVDTGNLLRVHTDYSLPGKCALSADFAEAFRRAVPD